MVWEDVNAEDEEHEEHKGTRRYWPHPLVFPVFPIYRL
jgi:hypothetical protein